MANTITYRELLKNREYVKLLFTNLIDRFGDSVDAIAFTWLTYQLTKSAAWSALIYGLNVLPNIVAQPFFGALVEKMDKKKVIIVTHLIRGVVISAFAVLYLTGKVNPYLLAAFTLLITTIESLNLPASTAFTPSVIEKDQLSTAMSLSSSVSKAVALAGTGIAGIIIAQLGMHAAMLIDAATFFIAALGTFYIHTLAELNRQHKTSKSDDLQDNVIEKPHTNKTQQLHTKNNKKSLQTSKAQPVKESYLSLLKGGAKYVIQNKIILNYCLVAVLLNFLLMPLNSLLAPLVNDTYQLGSELLSVISIASSAGSIIGSIFVPKLMKHFNARHILIIFGFVIGVFTYAISLGNLINSHIFVCFILAGGCIFMISMAAAIICGMLAIEFVTSVDQAYLARAASIFNASATAAMPISSFIVSGLVIHYSASFMIKVSGIMAILLFTTILISKLEFEIKKEESTNAA